LRAARLADLPAFRAALRPFRALLRAALLAALPLFRAALLAALPLFRAVFRPFRAVLRAERLADLPAFRADFLAAFFGLLVPGLLAVFRRGAAVSDWLAVGSPKSNERDDEGVDGVLSEGRGSIHPEPDQPISI
jgi:hypothetical protein